MDKHSEIVDTYLDGMLTANEEINFLDEVTKNNDLQKELLFQKEVRATIKDEGFAKLRNALSARSKKINNFPLRLSLYQLNSKRVVFAVAASVALLIVSSLLFIFLNGQIESPEQLAQKYYHPAKSIQHLRSIDESDLMGSHEAFDLYSNAQYALALEGFKSVENRIVSKFYSGICYYELGHYQQAVQCFDFVLNDKNNFFIEQTDWYLALTYLKLNELPKAKALFTKISASDSPYAGDSGEILEKLD